MMARKRRTGTPATKALIGLVVCGILLSGCTEVSPKTSGTQASDGSAITVKVKPRNITSTVVVDSTVGAQPEFFIESPTRGVVTLREEVVTGGQVVEGTSLGEVDGEAILAPASGTITDVSVDSGSTVAERVPLLAVAYEAFGVAVAVPVEQQYRLYDGAWSARVNITAGPSGQECLLVPDAAPTAPPSVLCLLPKDAPVVSGLAAKVGLSTGGADNVLSLPLQAVSGRAGSGEVTVVGPDGERSVVSVTLGISDGVYIEVVGLEEDVEVLSLAPGVQ